VAGDKYKESIKLWGNQNDREGMSTLWCVSTPCVGGMLGDKYKDGIKLWGGQNDRESMSTSWCV